MLNGREIKFSLFYFFKVYISIQWFRSYSYFHSYSLSFSSEPPKRMDVPEEGNPSLSQSSNTSDLDLAQLDALELSTHVNHPRKWTILRRVAGVASGVPTTPNSHSDHREKHSTILILPCPFSN